MERPIALIGLGEVFLNVTVNGWGPADSSTASTVKLVVW
jgi:hypothetical protein